MIFSFKKSAFIKSAGFISRQTYSPFAVGSSPSGKTTNIGIKEAILLDKTHTRFIKIKRSKASKHRDKAFEEQAKAASQH